LDVNLCSFARPYIEVEIVAVENMVERIQNSFNRIIAQCDEATRTRIDATSLVVSDETRALEVYNDAPFNIFRKAYTLGFGSAKGSVRRRNGKVHLVVLNFERINTENLTDAELDGVFAHELGHIFNKVPDRPKLLPPEHSQAEIQAANAINRKDNEFYADHFAKKVNCTAGLLSSFNKYVLSGDCKDEELFYQRRDKLESDEIFPGMFMEFTVD
jgi:hypothetical protein